MVHANPHAHSRSHIHWHTTRTPRLGLDLALIFAIVLGLTYLYTRVNTIDVSGLTGTLSQDSTSAQEDPILGSPVLTSVSNLIVDLKSPILSVRVNAAQALGSKHAVGATDGLLAATYDSDMRVREEAAASLGEIGSLRALPRLQELQITQGNSYVEIAAFEAQGKITRNIASALNIPVSGIQATAVANNGAAYAAALGELYSWQNGAWQHVSHLPATPNALSADPDGRLLYMSSLESGLYRSQDSGESWEHLQYGMETPTQLDTTAVVVNPRNVNQVYVALAVHGSTSDELNSIGIVASQDGGETWTALLNSPTWSVTHALLIDRTTPRYLYGLSDVGPWRYDLTPDSSSSD